MKAGVKEDDEKRQGFRAIMHENGRRRDETLSQYAMRMQRNFTKAATTGFVCLS